MISHSILAASRLLREPSVHATAAFASVPATAAGLHAAGISPDMDGASLASGLLDGGLWFTLGVVALFGALGGVIAELLSLHGNIELPHRVRRRRAKQSRLADARDQVDLGIVSRLLLGAAAAIAFLAVYTPTSATALVVNGLIAGSAATGVFRLVQGRLLGRASASASPAQRPRVLRHTTGTNHAQPAA